VSWLQKGHQILVNEQCKVEFQIGSYKDEVLCDIMPMDVYHIFLGRSWQYDMKDIHDGRRNSYSLENNGNKHVLLPKDGFKYHAEGKYANKFEEMQFYEEGADIFGVCSV
jgi:hypothetical protein